MNKYTKYISLDHLNNGEPTLVVDITGHTMTVDYGEENINGQFIKIRDTKHYLSGEVIDRFHELEELATPKKPRRKYMNLQGYDRFNLECPNCGSFIMFDTQYNDLFSLINNHCSKCGQALDWGK